MSREIKFRAWEKEKKQMKTSSILDIRNGVMSETESLVFMQYTGLKDKNGVEIYEGDIVISPSDEIGIVKWVNVRFHIDYSKSKKLGKFDWQLSASSTLEIIGNIYENKDLLK